MEESPAISRSLLDFGFDDDTLDDMTTCYATLNMFYELDLHSHFGIEKDVSFAQSVLLCLRCYSYLQASLYVIFLLRVLWTVVRLHNILTPKNVSNGSYVLFFWVAGGDICTVTR